jgi:hypothetical protein
MLTKLLKYDLKYMIKNMSIFYILGLFFAVVTRILFSLDQSFMVHILGSISVGCMFSMAASILINTMMRSWVRFRDSIYKDESYLTHTLPVTKNNIYNSKFIQTLIFFVFSFAFVIMCLFITYYTKERWEILKLSIDKITTGLDMNTWFFVIGMLLVVFLEFFNAIQCGFLGMILGHRRNNGKIGYSVIFGFLAYLISQSIILLLVFMVGVFDSGIMSLFKNEPLMDTSALKLLIVLSSVLYVLMIFAMNLLCKKILNKGVNVE